jgi:ankyrin repeat protein
MDIDNKLIEACTRGDLSVVKECLKQGADIHDWNNLALRWAARGGYLEVVKYLIEKGAYIHARDDESLWCAARNRHLQIVTHLRKVAGDAYKCHKCIIRSTCLDLCEDFRQYMGPELDF